MLSREYCERFKNSFLIEHHWWLLLIFEIYSKVFEVVESFECSGVFLENLLHILNNSGNEQSLNKQHWTKLFEKALMENVYDRVYF